MGSPKSVNCKRYEVDRVFYHFAKKEQERRQLAKRQGGSVSWPWEVNTRRSDIFSCRFGQRSCSGPSQSLHMIAMAGKVLQAPDVQDSEGS